KGTNRNRLERKRATRKNIRCWSSLYGRTYLQSLRSENVSLFSIRIVNQRNTNASVWIIFQTRNFTGVHLVSFEVDDSIKSLVPTASKTRGDVTMIISTATFCERFQQ